ncbi:MAG TPA: peptide MFS transporter, partial [Acetobacteraceae bacterium]|nr:peptide MFS transporter [Acetobacteraceae bacterium]
VDYLFIDRTPDMIFGYHTVKSALEFLYGPLGPQPLAALVYGLYSSGTYLTGLLGGFLSDRYFGQRRAVIAGGLTMAVGEFMLTDTHLFFPGLLTLVLGNGFFKPNIATQVGGLYKPGDQRIDRAYSVFYVGINLGALIAPIICGRVAHWDAGPPHWHYGFAAAGIGMLIGVAINLAGQRALPPDVRQRRMASATAHAPLTRNDRRAVAALCVVAFFNLFFWGCYEQQGLTIALMAEKYTNLGLPMHFRLDAEDIQSFNPFFIFAFTPLIIALWARQAARGREPSSIIKMAYGCAGTAAAYGLLIIPALSMSPTHKVTWLWLLAAMAIQTVGELYLSPVGLSLFSKAAPPKLASLMMAVNYLSNALGNYMAGYLGSYWAGMNKAAFFAMIAGIAALTSVGIFAASLVLNPILNERKEES